RAGVNDAAQRLLGQIRSEFEFRPVIELLDALPEHMEEVQAVCSAASDAIRQRYFPTSAVPVWIGETS
ncbi:MAG: alpha-E domain-containing protein, partial [Microbacteriaceae bacterium]|nr:alpha-E domain-containing protein [Microbacteriaceae bacterium]